MVKDEIDVIEAFVLHALTQVDRLIVADNLSTDGTSKTLATLALDHSALKVIKDPEIAYRQSEKMSALAARAARGGASWVVPMDADECWYSPFGRIADVLDHLDAITAPAALYDHVATGVDPADGPHTTRIGWRRTQPLGLPKIACRPALHVTIETGNHGARYPEGSIDGQLIVRHYPYRTPAQFVSKVRNGAAALAATDLPPDTGKHWRDYGHLLEGHGEEAIADVFRTYFWSAEPERDSALIYDPLPA